MVKVKLAEALLRRKELAGKVDQLKTIQAKDLVEVKLARKAINESTDDIVAQVPLLKPADITAAYDWHARQLRLVDAAIQQANWTAEVELHEESLKDFVQPVRPTEGRGVTAAKAAT